MKAGRIVADLLLAQSAAGYVANFVRMRPALSGPLDLGVSASQVSRVKTWTLDEVLDMLDLHRQRATYGAVGEVVRRPPLYLMGGRPRDFRHSWVVGKSTGLPTNYGPDDMHPDLRSRAEVLSTGEELAHWLEAPR